MHLLLLDLCKQGREDLLGHRKHRYRLLQLTHRTLQQHFCLTTDTGNLKAETSRGSCLWASVQRNTPLEVKQHCLKGGKKKKSVLDQKQVISEAGAQRVWGHGSSGHGCPGEGTLHPGPEGPQPHPVPGRLRGRGLGTNPRSAPVSSGQVTPGVPTRRLAPVGAGDPSLPPLPRPDRETGPQRHFPSRPRATSRAGGASEAQPKPSRALRAPPRPLPSPERGKQRTEPATRGPSPETGDTSRHPAPRRSPAAPAAGPSLARRSGKRSSGAAAGALRAAPGGLQVPECSAPRDPSSPHAGAVAEESLAAEVA